MVLDATGKPMVAQPKPTLMANVREEKREQFRKAQMETADQLAATSSAGADLAEAVYVDPRVKYELLFKCTSFL